MSLLQTRLRWQQIQRSGRPTQLKLAVLASFTAHPLLPYLGLALEEADLASELWVGPYNQVIQETLSPDSDTARFRPDVLVSWSRLEELWSGQPLPLTDDSLSYATHALEVAEASLKAARGWQATLLFVLPAVPELRPLGVGDAGNPNGVFATATAVRETLRHKLAHLPGVLLLDSEEVIRQLGSSKAYNPRLFATARIPYTEEAFSQLGTRMARLIRLSRQAARKVVVVDADNTLWGGVVGEDGPFGVDLADNGPGEAYRSFQSYLLELRRAGLLLALSSKNNEADLWEVFGRREMQLKPDHFSAWRINWQSKATGLSEIAADLNLGLASFVFIDDNPVELAEVQIRLPEVGLLQMPEDPAEWETMLQNTALLDRLPPTTEDLQRASQYQQERQRAELQTGRSAEAFLAKLEVQVAITTPGPSDVARLAQLVAKTNQFNLNCKRRSQAELSELCQNENYLVRLIHAQDRFGDYGIIGVYILELGSTQARLDTFLLSCRAMGRQVENAMINTIFTQANSSPILACVENTSKNEPAKRFFAQLGCEVVGQPFVLRPLEWPQYVQKKFIQ